MELLDVVGRHRSLAAASMIAGMRSPERNRHSLCSSNTAQTATETQLLQCLVGWLVGAYLKALSAQMGYIMLY